jgi:hypothetical protein
MYKFRYFFLATVVAFSLTACKSSTDANSFDVSNTTLGNWVQVAEIDGAPRYYASSFVIGNYAYVVGGIGNGLLTTASKLSDMWCFDPAANGGVGSWRGGIGQLASIPVGRNSAVAFTIGDKGYVGTGNTVTTINQSGVQLNDMWEYDPATNEWKRKGSVPGGPRFAAVGFSIGNLGYVGTGRVEDPNNPGTSVPIKDFYSFDPSQGDSGKWVVESSMINDKRFYAQSFVYNNQGYVVGGVTDGSSRMSVDFEVFTPGSTQGAGSWRTLTPITPISDSSKTSNYTSDLARCSGVVLIVGNNAYLCTGSTSYQGATVNNTWMYNFPPIDSWVQRTPYETNNGNNTSRSPRFGAVGFVVNGRAFLGTGTGSTSGSPLSKFDEWLPNDPQNLND